MEYDIGAEESVSDAVVRAVSAVEGREPCSLRPLPEVVDPDALNGVFDGRETADATHDEIHLTFVYSKCRVTVRDAEQLTLRPIDPRISDERR